MAKGRTGEHLKGKDNPVSAPTQFTSDRQPENAGRKPGIPNTATRLKRFLEVEIKRKNHATDKEEDMTVAEAMDMEQIKKALAGDTSAWEKILDRLEGKARQSHEFSGEITTKLNLDSLTLEEKRKALEILGKANGS